MGCVSSKFESLFDKHDKPDELPFLHGVLYASIHFAKDLPNTDRQGMIERGLNVKDTGDPYAMVLLDDYRVVKTSTINNELNPTWEERFRVDVAYPCRGLHIKVKDEDLVGKDDLLGQVSFEVNDILTERQITGSQELLDKNGKPNGGTINVELQYKSVETLKATNEVPDCYFPIRPTCRVTLYQDAHTPHNPLFDEVKLASGETYKPTNAWIDILNAINGAQKFIYVTGWAVFTNTSLLREGEEEVLLGELLKKKAEEGVCVLAMVWDEKLSTEVTPGLMGTHDEETENYFQDTKVKLMLVPRRREGLLADQFVSTCYSHHQKTIILDAEGTEGGKRRLVSFVGGLDLTDGRWDTPNHDLFSSLTTYHKSDFYNSSATVKADAGPRQPWHDIHARVEGRAAYDVMLNFTERWHKQLSKHDDLLFSISEDEFDLDATSNAEESDQWSVQLFRSINMDSAIFDPARWLGLSGKKKRARDNSIHRAYAHHIRRAKEFIYIENQYFQGSCNFWKAPETQSDHLVPVEIVTKICEKIQANERFVTYVVIPMFPEGDPTSAAIQEMLHWQKCTMEMMYSKIAVAIKKQGIEAEPTDYLSFYCLGNREDAIPEGLADPKPDSQEATLRESKRFMVYVHSKMMICDDEYIIVGSANINQRSMGGNRDTEIAVGMEQNEFTMRKVGGLPRGNVHGFRLALWAEHLACMEEVFLQPASVECVRKVNELARENWDLFCAPTPSDMKGHLLQYPVKVTENGAIKELPDFKNFPDTEARVLGSRSAFLPHKLTT